MKPTPVGPRQPAANPTVVAILAALTHMVDILWPIIGLAVVLAVPRCAHAQSYRMYGLPDTVYVTQQVRVYGIARDGSRQVCPNCTFTTDIPSIGTINQGNVLTLWNQSLDTAIYVGALTVTGTPASGPAFSKVVHVKLADHIVIYCGIAVCPAPDALHPTDTQQQIAYGFDKQGRQLWHSR